jgi:hypothetical protein
VKVAKTTDEAYKLIECGFVYVTEICKADSKVRREP